MTIKIIRYIIFLYYQIYFQLFFSFLFILYICNIVATWSNHMILLVII